MLHSHFLLLDMGVSSVDGEGGRPQGGQPTYLLLY